MALALFKPTSEPVEKIQFYKLRVFDCSDPLHEVGGKRRRFDQNIKVPIRLEEKVQLDKVEFNVFKFNNRPKPKDRRRRMIIGCFSEFGCETVGNMYCIPRLIKRYPGFYIIAMGWHGREYLYRHLVDEFWEIKEEYMWLREYARAFENRSENIRRVEQAACNQGMVVPSATLGNYAVGNACRTCGKFWADWKFYSEHCPHCKSTVITRSIFSDTKKYRKEAVHIPKPSQKAMDWAKSILKPNTVGIFARGRKAYGRNLQPEFYVKLIHMLQDKGYNVAWLGEKQSILPCPVDGVFDFSVMPESRDLEKTLAIVANLSFTIQFWTASTRLSGMVGTPFLLFESPDQIYATAQRGAQEGRRLELTSFGPKKICLCHFGKALLYTDKALDCVSQCVEQMEDGDYSEFTGLVEEEGSVELLKNTHYDILR